MYEHQKTFSGNLHALRGLAATSVVFFHAKNMSPAIDVGYLSIVQQFGAGVTLFFILSGFSLSLSNYKKIGQADWLHGYAIRRVARIFPIWYFFVLFTFFFHWWKYGLVYPFSDLIYHIIPFYVFIPGGHTSFVWAGWTIGVELLFYLFFPYLLIFAKTRILAWSGILVGAILLSLNLREFAPEGLSSSFYYMTFANQAFVFVLGCLLFFVSRRVKETNFQRLYTYVIGGISVLSFAWWGATVLNPVDFSMHPYGLIVKAAALGCLTAFLYLSEEPKRSLYNPVTKFLGDKSYTIYLAHPIVVSLTKRFYPRINEIFPINEMAYLAYTSLVLALTFMVAALISTYIEEPLYIYGRRLAKR